MNFVGEILKAKGYNVWTVSSDSTVYNALQEMADRNVGALLVIEGDRLVGFSRSETMLEKSFSTERLPKRLLLRRS